MKTFNRNVLGACVMEAILLASQSAVADSLTSGSANSTAASGNSTTCPTPVGTGTFSVTPELLTAVGGTTGASTDGKSQTTLGIDYNAEKAFSFGESLQDRIIKTSPPDKPPTAAAWGIAQIQACGKVAADSKVNVGDAIIANVSSGGQWQLAGDTRDFAGYGSLQAKGAFEGGQRLSTKNYTYGASSFLQFSPTPRASDKYYWLNVFDWPGFLLRPLTMSEEDRNQVKGQARSWPTLVLEFARVDPSTDTMRKAVDPALESYNRVHEKLSVASQLGQFPNGGRAIIFDFSIDHWQQVHPSHAIEAARLARETYRSFALIARGSHSDADWLITYTSGSVPTDQSSVKVWQLGWNYKFQ